MNIDCERPWFAHYDSFVPHDTEIWNKPLHVLLDEAAERYPTRAAVIFQNTRISYAQLLEKAERFAGALRDMGVRQGQRVAVMMPNLPQTVVAFWGIVKAGAVVVMLNPLYKEKELLAHIGDSGAEHIILLDMLWPCIDALRDRLPLRNFILTSVADALSFPLNWLYRFKQRHATQLPQASVQVHTWRNFCRKAERFAASVENPRRDPVMLQYTGGTTGLPKGVALTHANLGTNCRQVLDIIRATADEGHVFLSLLPFFHVYGLTTGLIIPVAIAATVLPLPRYVPQDVLRSIAKFRPSVFPGAPSVYSSLLQQKNLSNYDLRCIKICVSGSAPLPRETFRRFQEATGASILEGYGLTEASPITHCNPLGQEGQRANSIGMPVPGTDARIVDMESGTIPLPPGKLGELIIRGPQVMSGYWRRPDDTANALRNGWLYTGDLATMDEDGYFYIVDRKKDMVIVGGYNVYPREVDEVLLEHPKVQEAVCVGIPDELRGETLKAYVVLRHGENMDKAEVIAWCRRKLANYKVPRLVEFREELPRTIVGKVLRRALREEEMRKNAERRDKHGHIADAKDGR